MKDLGLSEKQHFEYYKTQVSSTFISFISTHITSSLSETFRNSEIYSNNIS